MKILNLGFLAIRGDFSKLMAESGGIELLCSFVKWETPLEYLRIVMESLHRIADVDTLAERGVVQALVSLVTHALATMNNTVATKELFSLTIKEVIKFASHLKPESMELKSVLGWAQLTSKLGTAAAKVMAVKLIAELAHEEVLSSEYIEIFCRVNNKETLRSLVEKVLKIFFYFYTTNSLLLGQ